MCARDVALASFAVMLAVDIGKMRLLAWNCINLGKRMKNNLFSISPTLNVLFKLFIFLRL